MQQNQTCTTNRTSLGNCLNVSEVAKKLGIGKSTVWQKLNDDPCFPRSFPLFSEGKSTRWLEADVDKYITNRMSMTMK